MEQKKIMDNLALNSEGIINMGVVEAPNEIKNSEVAQVAHRVGNTLADAQPSVKARKWLFVWNNYTSKEMEQMEQWCKENCDKYTFQEEKGSSGTPHLQGYWDFKNPRSFASLKKIFPKLHIEKCNNAKRVEAYCRKEETRNGATFTNVVPERELKLITVLRPWQQSIIDQIKEEPDDRTVNWVFDKTGCMGKTVFSKYLFAKHKAIIATGGGNKDIACLLATLKNEGRNLNDLTTFIFNFPRSTEGVSYKAIESVKDGLMTSVKYESSTLVFNCPHVWIFSNEMPIEKHLSNDRWCIWTIENEELILLRGNRKIAEDHGKDSAKSSVEINLPDLPQNVDLSEFQEIMDLSEWI